LGGRRGRGRGGGVFFKGGKLTYDRSWGAGGVGNGWSEKICRAVLEWWGVFEVLFRGRLHQIPSSDLLKLWLFHLVDEVVMAANERIAFHS